jgi:hypothetical protein
MSTVMAEFETPSEVAERNPKHAYIESTDRCNTRCLHCGHYHHTFGADMPEPLATKALDALIDGLDLVIAQGVGEPLLAKSFHSILATCEKRDVNVAFTTNAILLRDEALVRRLVRGRVGICVSIDGARPETFGFVRPLLSWERLLEALALVRRCAEEAGPDCRSSLSFLCVAMKDTIGDLSDLVRMAAEYGAKGIHVQALSGDNGLEKLRGQPPHGAPDVVVPACLEAMAVAHELGIWLGLPPSFLSMIRDHANSTGELSSSARHAAAELLAQEEPAPEESRMGPKTGIRPCLQPWEWTFVAASGIVRACCMGGATLGDLNTQEWDEIWNGPLYRSFRRTIHSWNPPQICRTCMQNNGIHGGDNTKYDRYFAQFRSEPVALEAQDVRFGEGFGATEDGEGRTPAWRLPVGPGALSLPMRPGARFLRLNIEPSQPADPTPGVCTIGDGPPEPFDTSCRQVHLPLDLRGGHAPPSRHVDADRLDVHLQMDPGPGRGLVIRDLEFLF